MKVALPGLTNLGLGDRRDELAGIVVDLAREAKADLVVFPELSVCGYPALVDAERDESLVLALSEDVRTGPSATLFTSLARETGCALVYGICERDPADGRRFNTLVRVGADGVLGSYRKIHLTPAEQRHWVAGDEAVVVASDGTTTGLSLCYDKSFPAVYQRQRERGAEMSVICSAWSNYPGSTRITDDVWAAQSELFDRARAAETGMLVISTNWSGPKFAGASESFCDGRRIVDGLGRLVEPIGEHRGSLLWDVDAAGSAADVELVNGGDFFARDRRTVR